MSIKEQNKRIKVSFNVFMMLLLRTKLLQVYEKSAQSMRFSHVFAKKFRKKKDKCVVSAESKCYTREDNRELE